MSNHRENAMTDELLFRIINDIETMSDRAIFTRSRKQKDLMVRVFFCYILIKEYKLKDREVTTIFADRGVKYDRSSIYIAIRKFDYYLKNFIFMQQLYSKYSEVNYDIKGDLLDLIYDNYYLKDKEFLSIVNEEMSSLSDSVKVSEEVVSDVVVSDNAIAIAELTDSLTAVQEAEVLDMVRLKVRSYAWKSRDNVKIFSGASYAEQL